MGRARLIPFVSLHLGRRAGLDLGFGNPPLFTWGVVGTSDRNFGKTHYIITIYAKGVRVVCYFYPPSRRPRYLSWERDTGPRSQFSLFEEGVETMPKTERHLMASNIQTIQPPVEGYEIVCPGVCQKPFRALAAAVGTGASAGCLASVDALPSSQRNISFNYMRRVRLERTRSAIPPPISAPFPPTDNGPVQWLCMYICNVTDPGQPKPARARRWAENPQAHPDTHRRNNHGRGGAGWRGRAGEREKRKRKRRRRRRRRNQTPPRANRDQSRPGQHTHTRNAACFFRPALHSPLLSGPIPCLAGGAEAGTRKSTRCRPAYVCRYVGGERHAGCMFSSCTSGKPDEQTNRLGESGSGERGSGHVAFAFFSFFLFSPPPPLGLCVPAYLCNVMCTVFGSCLY
ncbi:hypothetical protein BT67DRAFT_241528 [Trichocladium antarcticum]|uniref:Uncharacterized protein n=1 Tax=Trichocladium antarcticum TaxID=1450529 RepID=A0AAN6Z9J2_9PEZI|nr:hypothetical protein BT67DRAFT_241528 [Trichocladium antarcticum]